MVENSITASYGGALTSDAILVVREEARITHAEAPSPKCIKLDSGGSSSSSCLRIDAHKAVLWHTSEYFQCKIRNWTNNSSSKPEITLLVPHGQLDIGKALISAAYGKLPDQLSQQELMQLLTLADSYQIGTVTSAVVSKLSSLPVDELEWDTVLAAKQLPAEEQFQPVIAAANARFMRVLGDLEIVWALEMPQQRHLMQQLLPPGSAAAKARVKHWVASRPRADPAKLQAAEEAAAAAAHSSTPPHELLLQLSFEQLTELLRCRIKTAAGCGIRTASENVVYYTMQRWLQHHTTVEPQQCKQLAQLLRLGCCTPNYLINVISTADSWTNKMLSQHELVRCISMSVGYYLPKADGYLSLAHRPDYRMRIPRLPSAMRSLQMSWHIPVVQILGAYREALQNKQDEALLVTGYNYQYQGSKFQLKMVIDLKADEHWEPDVVGELMSISAKAETAASITYTSRITAHLVDEDVTELEQQFSPMDNQSPCIWQCPTYGLLMKRYWMQRWLTQ